MRVIMHCPLADANFEGDALSDTYPNSDTNSYTYANSDANSDLPSDPRLEGSTVLLWSSRLLCLSRQLGIGLLLRLHQARLRQQYLPLLLFLSPSPPFSFCFIIAPISD